MFLAHRLRFLLISLLAWHAVFGLLLLVRRTGTRELTTTWIPMGMSQILAWFFMSSLLGVTYWLITLATETQRFRKRPYRDVIVFKTGAMIAAVCTYFLVTRLLALATGRIDVTGAWNSIIAIFGTPLAAVLLVYITVATLTISVFRLLATTVGARVLINLLLGKYHQPQTERRIFMFLDLEGSTGLAERLGHTHFCRLIQECFRDLANSAIVHRVEIYQYVGDEAILTWLPSDGLKNGNCVRIHGEFQRTLDSRANYYREQFGVKPRFKAGVNMGLVTVAEVGVVKRDIAYLSDVLNTAARLESLCSQYEANLLVAGNVKEALPPTPDLQFDLVGNLALRGRSEPVDVYRVLNIDQRQ